MRLTDALRGEHGVFYAWFDQIETLLSEKAPVDVLRAQARALAGALVPHAELENTLLFAALEPKIGPMGPLAVMRHEHEEIEAGIGAAAEEQDATVLAQKLSASLALARDHFNKEEQVLYPMAEQQLDDGELVSLAREWATSRRVSLR